MYRKGSFGRSSLAKYKYEKQSQFGPRIYTPQGKMQNRIWEFKIGDADDHPSIPHAHSRETGERLNVWTGDIYPAGNERVPTGDKLKKKELRRLYSDPKFIEFAKKQIEWYRNTYPHITFAVPEWFEAKCRMSHLNMKKTEKEITDYIFVEAAFFK